MAFQSLEHQMIQFARKYSLSGQKLVVAVSAGVDSVVLLKTLCETAPVHKCHLSVAHIHHGELSSAEQTQFRNQAQQFVEALAEAEGLECRVIRSEVSLSSEAKARDFRLQSLQEIQSALNADFVVLGQHSDDLLETRLIRLIRGLGPEGLQAMSENYDRYLRPLLGVSRQEIQAYAKAKGLRWLEDPSNHDSEYTLRNWLRREWLPSLEQFYPGGRKSVSRSLELINQSLCSNELPEGLVEEAGIWLERFWTVSEAQQLQAIAAYSFHKFGARGAGLSHHQEVLKQVSARNPSSEILVNGLSWRIFQGYLFADLASEVRQ